MTIAPHHLAFLLFICMIWGFTFVAGKAGVVEFPPLLFTALRYVLLSAVLLPFLKIHPGQMKQIGLIAITMGSLHFALFYAGMALSDNVSAVAIVVQLGAPFATMLSVLVLGERIGFRRISAIALSFAGVMIIGFDPIIFNDIDGLSLIVVAAFIGAVGMIVMRQMKEVSPFDLQAWVALLSWPPLVLCSALFESQHIEVMRNASWMGWGGVLYTALAASLIGHAGMYYLLQRYEVSLISTLTLLAPVFGVMFGIFIWGDEASWRFLLGGVIVLIGSIIIVEREGARRQPLERGA